MSASKLTSQISSFTKDRKRKISRFVSKDDARDNDVDREGWTPLNDEPAFNPSQLKHRHSAGAPGTRRTSRTLRGLRQSIIHPKTTIKSKATKSTASRLSRVERPFLSQEADLEYLHAHDKLEQAKEGMPSQRNLDSEPSSVVCSKKDRVQELEAHRESLRIAWTTGRHVQRVRVILKGSFPHPRSSTFRIRDAKGNDTGFNWMEWLGQSLIHITQGFCAQYIDENGTLHFDVNNTRRYVERILFASAPWQAWAMKVRSVYRWDEPRVTFRWLILYLYLWHTEHIAGFIYAYVLYIVIKNRFFPTTVESLRGSARRAMDSSSKAERLVELIDKHGNHDWLRPVLDEIGPYAQTQLGDLANMLECLVNFYSWKRPEKTFATLVFFAACLLVTLLTDMVYCMKIVWFVAGGTFFVCFPIASRYPRYRYLVSPLKWTFWEVPTDAEWSFQYLRRQAQIDQDRMNRPHSTKTDYGIVADSTDAAVARRLISRPQPPVGDTNDNDDLSNSSYDDEWHSASSTFSLLESGDVRSFRGSYQLRLGRLVISTARLRFVDSSTNTEVWTVPFMGLASLTKFEGGKASKMLLSPHQLQIQTLDNETFLIKGLRERDEAFNNIVAFSGLQWQSQQPLLR